LFFVICVVHNAVFTVLLALHELYIGPKMGGDLTLMPEMVCLDRRDELTKESPEGMSATQAMYANTSPLLRPLEDDPPLPPAPELTVYNFSVNKDDSPSYAKSYGELDTDDPMAEVL